MSRPSADIAGRAIHGLATLPRFPVYRLEARGTANASSPNRTRRGMAFPGAAMGSMAVLRYLVIG